MRKLGPYYGPATKKQDEKRLNRKAAGLTGIVSGSTAGLVRRVPKKDALRDLGGGGTLSELGESITEARKSAGRGSGIEKLAGSFAETDTPHFRRAVQQVGRERELMDPGKPPQKQGEVKAPNKKPNQAPQATKTLSANEWMRSKSYGRKVLQHIERGGSIPSELYDKLAKGYQSYVSRTMELDRMALSRAAITQRGQPKQLSEVEKMQQAAALQSMGNHPGDPMAARNAYNTRPPSAPPVPTSIQQLNRDAATQARGNHPGDPMAARNAYNTRPPSAPPVPTQIQQLNRDAATQARGNHPGDPMGALSAYTAAGRASKPPTRGGVMADNTFSAWAFGHPEDNYGAREGLIPSMSSGTEGWLDALRDMGANWPMLTEDQKSTLTAALDKSRPPMQARRDGMLERIGEPPNDPQARKQWSATMLSIFSPEEIEAYKAKTGRK